MKKLTTLITISSVGLMAAGSAAAAGPLVGGYAGKAGTAVGSVLGSKTPNLHTTAHTGTLPFTGFNLAAFAVFALLLVLLGVLMVRAGRRDQSKQ